MLKRKRNETPASAKDAAQNPKTSRKRPAPASPPQMEPETVRFSHPFRGYRVTYEDGCEAEVRSSAGRFFPFDGERVAFYCKDTDVARRVRRKFPEKVEVFAQGDEETTFLLPSRLYPQVAALAGAEKRAN